MGWQEKYIERFYRGKPGWLDGTQEFHALCSRYVDGNARVLEVGPGRGGQTTPFLQSISAGVVGLDVDDEVRENPCLVAACVYDGSVFPLESDSFDCVVSDYVLEHVADPALLCGEVHRVLRPGGVFVFRTPGAFHYVSVLSRILPDRPSLWARDLEKTHRVFPKYFRFNSERVCRRILVDVGLDVLEFRQIEKEPSYGMKSRFLFFPMMLYERMVNASNAFRHIRANILCAARKPLH